jgi:hypothetical protein
MLASFRRLSWRRTQPCSVACCHRNITFSATRQAEVEKGVEAEEPADDELEMMEGESEEGPRVSNSAEMLDTFLHSVGAPFRTPQKPNNWLGDDRVRYFLLVAVWSFTLY